MIQPLDKKPFAEILPGKRITLKRTSPPHTSLVWESIRRDHSMGGSNYSWIETEEQVAKYITNQSEQGAKEIDYLIFESGRVIGSFHIHTMSYADHKAEVGYALEKGETSKGYVSEALALVESEMRKLGFNKLIINCSSDNLRSIKVAERNNFRREGLFLQDCIEYGQFRDSVIFGKLLKSNVD